MQSPRTGRRKAQVNTEKCVACGSCVKICPRRAIEVYRGMVAKIDPEKCIGCGKCAKECPAAAIAMRGEAK